MKLIFLAWLLMIAVICNAEEGVTVTETIQQVKAKHQGRLMSMRGVVAVGIGQNHNGQSAIIVSVESQDKLDRITLPKELEGYPVKVQITGAIRAQ